MFVITLTSLSYGVEMLRKNIARPAIIYGTFPGSGNYGLVMLRAGRMIAESPVRPPFVPRVVLSPCGRH
jgi:hypothetical protein